MGVTLAEKVWRDYLEAATPESFESQDELGNLLRGVVSRAEMLSKHGQKAIDNFKTVRDNDASRTHFLDSADSYIPQSDEHIKRLEAFGKRVTGNAPLARLSELAVEAWKKNKDTWTQVKKKLS